MSAEGLRLQHAIFVYSADQDHARAVRLRWVDRADLDQPQQEELDADVEALKAELRAALRTGGLRLGGFDADGRAHAMTFPDLHWCTTAKLDIDGNTAVAHKLVLRDVRIFRAEPSATSETRGRPIEAPPTRTARPWQRRRNTSPESVSAWMTKRIDELKRVGEKFDRKGIIAAAQRELDCNRETARAAMTKTLNRNKVGPPKRAHAKSAR